MGTRFAKTALVLLTVGALALAAGAAEAGKKRRNGGGKGKKKASEPAAVQAPAAPAALATAPTRGLLKVHERLLAWDTEGARRLLDPIYDAADPAARLARGRVLAQEKAYDEAARELEAAAAAAPEDPAPLLFLGEDLLLAGRAAAANDAFARAEQRARALLARDSGNRGALYLLGVAEQRQMRFDAAAATLERARAADPGNAEVLFQLGATRAFQERWQEAFDLLSEAVQKDSGIAYAYYYRGLAAGKLGRKDLLVNDLERFLTLAPQSPDAAKAQKVLASS